MKARNIQLTIGLSAYILGTLIFSILAYHHTKTHLIEDIDERLKSAAFMTATLLGDNFHFQNMEDTSITPKKDTETSLLLTELTREMGLEYVYSAIENQNIVYFTASSGTKDEIKNKQFQNVFLTKYEEANEKLLDAFATQNIYFSEYTDRWGTFRSIYIPKISSDGKEYVVAADISLERVHDTSRESAMFAIMTALILGAIGFPLAFLYSKSVRREAKHELNMLYRCPLTQLPNRARLLADLEKRKSASIAIINIDRFREITSLYGPAIGDDVLKQVGVRLRTYDAYSSRLENFKAYRLNSDEFAVLVLGEHTFDILSEELHVLYLYLTKNPYKVGLERINVRMRIGAAENSSSDEVFLLADMALREAKNNNKSLVLYHESLHIAESYRKNLENTQAFKKAIDEKRFTPYFQPIMDAKTGSVGKYECLARMVDNEGKVISMPDDFLPVAYRSRLYHKFSQLILDKVLIYLKENPGTVSINISATDINHAPTRNYFYTRLSQSGSAHRVEFEILENQSIENMKKVVRFINRLKALGCRVGIDDLGKDHSNIDRLMVLPVDFVKIDGSIILHLATDIDAQEIVKKIIEYSSKRNVKTVAEFCCSEDITMLAKKLGIDYLQGYHIGKPLADFIH